MKALVFQHVGHEAPGRLGELMRENGFDIQSVNFGAGDGIPEKTDDFAALVVMGGPMNVYESGKYPYLESETRFLSDFIKSGRAVMGICLGAQLMAVALGARVYAGDEKEIGWYDITVTDEAADDAVFGAFSRTEKVFQWHGDTFDVPAGAERLAFSDYFPNQAFKYGEKAYALQFHIETNGQMVRDWLGKEENRRELESGVFDTEKIESDIGVYGGDMGKLADSVFSSFLKLV
ncbi:MAG: amidotransferase [Candidatus Mycalebacterium zealandia]|nr:MAG: amidotransferase [Candidatus Mycalebacterium zealandia]